MVMCDLHNPVRRSCRYTLCLCLTLITTLITTLLTDPALAADVQPGVTLETDQESIYLGDSVIIDVEAIGLVDTLDVSPLFRDADLLRETTGTRIAVINERVVEVKIRRMEFLPRKVGTAFFGPLTAEHIDGTASSNALRVNVLPAADIDWQPSIEDHALSISLSSSEPYVGQRITLDISLKHRYPITNETINLPDFAGFDVLPVYEQRRTIEEAVSDDEENDNEKVNGKAKSSASRVIAWRYFLFPQRSGAISIGTVNWQGTMIRSRTQRGEFSLNETAPDLQVKLSASDDAWWLPASGVRLDDAWSIDPKELTAGDEVIRTITLSAQDVLANHLPVIEPLPSRAISSTLVRQSREHKLIGEVLNATASFEFRMTAQSPIPVFLDTVRVPWWDTTSDEAQEAIIPARRINVGLPDRADLLSDVALAEQPLARIMLSLQSSGRRWSSWHWALGLLSILGAVVLLRELRWQWSQYRARREARKQGRLVSVFDEL